MWAHCKLTLNLPNSFECLATVLIFVSFFSSVAYADVCVWRDPERTMSMIFPAAQDYKTLDRKISNDKLMAIEKRLGKPLDPGERENWSDYEIIGTNGKTIGHIVADAEKGEYGVIEVVMGIDTDGKVRQVYVQRARERDKEFKSKDFLKQFENKSDKDSIMIGKDIKAQDSVPTQQVAFAVRKMFIMFDELQ